MKKVFFSLFVIVVLIACDKSAMSDTAASFQGGQGGSMARFAIVGNYLYTVDRENLKVFDITNPAEPLTIVAPQLVLSPTRATARPLLVNALAPETTVPLP